MSSQPRRKKSKPSAKTRVRKINTDLLSSQLSQSQVLQKSPERKADIFSQSGSQRRALQTPVRRNVAPNSMVKVDQTIFSPIKQPETEINGKEDDDSLDESDSGDSENHVIEVESDSDSGSGSEMERKASAVPPETQRSILPLKKYTVPLNTRNWQPLPPHVHAELSTLLQLLVPPILETSSDLSKYSDSLQSCIVRPLTRRFGSVYLPPLQKSAQKMSGDFNLTTLHQEQTKLLSSYDINSKQLDTLKLQLSKEKEMLATEQKYLSQLSEKAKTWKKRKNERMMRLVSELGPKFSAVGQSLDTRSSGLDGADDVDMIIDNAEHSFEGEEKVSKELKELNKRLQELKDNSSESRAFQVAVQQLLNHLQMDS
jgi:hypothetical protein